MINGYLRTYCAAVDGLAGMHSETQFQALVDAGVGLANTFQDVGISGSLLVSDRLEIWPETPGDRAVGYTLGELS